VVGVVVEESERDLVESCLDRADLGEDVDAVPVLVDHALDPADLPLDPTQAALELVLGGAVAASSRSAVSHALRIPYTRPGYSGAG
jgi:hypothetical protein